MLEVTIAIAPRKYEPLPGACPREIPERIACANGKGYAPVHMEEGTDATPGEAV